MKAELRQRIADRAAELAVDKFQAFCDEHVPSHCVIPEDLLDIQHEIEDELYRELASVKV